MRRGVRLRRRKKIIKKKKKILFFVLFFVGISVFFTLQFFGKLVTPILLETSQLEIQKISNFVANRAISQVVSDDLTFQNLFETVTSSDGSIQTIDFNPIAVNQILSITTNAVLKNLRMLENGELNSEFFQGGYFTSDQLKSLKKGILEEIPFGLVTKNPLLSNLGPKIPVRIHYIGDVLGNITTNITSYGINNALVQIGLHLEVTAQIRLPYLTKEQVVQFDIPLSIKMIQGKIPTYYGGGISKDSTLYTMPID